MTMKLSFWVLILMILFSNQLEAKEKKVYTVGVEGIPFLPYSESKGRNYNGVLKKILSDFSQQENIKLTFSPLPIKRLYALFFNGSLDFKFPSNPVWQKNIKDQRKLKIHYSSPVLSFIDGLMVKKVGQKLSELKKIGTITGFTPWMYLDRIKSGKLELYENPSINGVLQQGILGRVDGVFINLAVGKYYLREDLKFPGRLKFDPNLPHEKSEYYLSTINHPEIITKFNSFLVKYKKTLEELQEKVNKGYQ